MKYVGPLAAFGLLALPTMVVARALADGAPDISATTCAAPMGTPEANPRLFLCAHVAQPAGTAQLIVATTPGARCTASVVYETPRERARLAPAGATPRTAGRAGILQWTWSEQRYADWGLGGVARVRCVGAGTRMPDQRVVPFALVPPSDEARAVLPGPFPTATPFDRGGQITTASGFTVTAAVLPNPVLSGSNAVLTATTTPGAICTASLGYTRGTVPPTFTGAAQPVPASGVVSWTWVETNTNTSATALVTCTYRQQSAHTVTTFSVA